MMMITISITPATDTGAAIAATLTPPTVEIMQCESVKLQFERCSVDYWLTCWTA